MSQYADIIEKGEEPIKFAIVGVTGIFVNFLMIFVSKEILNLNDEIALAMGIVFSVTSNYLLNRVWTFKSDRPILDEYIKYVASNFIGFMTQYVIAYAIVKLSPIENLELPFLDLQIDIIYVGSTVGILVGFISNFLLSKFYVFKKEEII